jgi:hypothetical protein
MREFEVAIESMNPCGGEQYAQREIREIETDDPVAWVRAQTGITDVTVEQLQNGLLVIAGQNGYIKRFTFTEF